MPHSIDIRAQSIELVIFDLDGVITDTADLHARAWKQLFDDFLRSHEGGDFEPFDIQGDYRAYVDGRRRYDGVATFLASRGITLDPGAPEDAPGESTVCGLGNRKNRLFLELLEKEGVQAFPQTVALLGRLHAAGIAMAVVSASRNCRAILDATGLTEEFAAIVDGIEAARLELKGKPAPDTFLEAARSLQVPPERAIVIEDAVAGVAAGRAGGFAQVIGIDAGAQAQALLDAGAHVALPDLSLVEVHPLPSALDTLPEILEAARQAPSLLVCLDYDGTLTPIVSNPEDAVLPADMRTRLARLQGLVTVAVITGRDLPVIKSFVNLDGISYAADHGFDVETADGARFAPSAAERYVGDIDKAEAMLRERFASIDGTQVERKRYSLAAHYRRVSPRERERTLAVIDEVLAAYPGLKSLAGKRVVELMPGIEWDKGEAVANLARNLGVPFEHILYMGDDVTDEAALRLVRSGVGIVVREAPRPSAGRYALASVSEVGQFLTALVDGLEERVS